MEVNIINNSEEEIDETALTQWIQKVCSELKNNSNISSQELDKSLTVVFVDEREIERLNSTFRKKNSVTDILSFSSVEEDSLGELAVCLSVVYNKKVEGFSDVQWLYYLLIHGVLHLLGFEHEREEEAAQLMYQIQAGVFEKLMMKK